MTPRTSSAAWVRGITDMLTAQGLPAADLCTQAGIDLQALQQPHTRVDVDRVSHLWELAVARHGNPALGLDRNLTARYGTVALQSDPRGYWLVLSHIGATRRIPRLRVEYAVLTLLTLCHWLTRRELTPLAVELITPPPTDDTPHRAAFGLLPRFGQPANRFLLADVDLRSPIPTHNPSLWALHERLVETELDQLGQTLTSTRVRTEIARILHLGEPRREDVAARLHLTDRTLQRRLQAESVCYQQLLDDTRCERQYLANERHSLADIADLLGFADTSNLFRACKRWFGMPPGQYRSQLLTTLQAPMAPAVSG